ncbi:MAG: DUF5719 family protein [Actinomycetota bacterium]|nr:DUF5719 family protein [Actinomycetota bacterium]
MSFLKRRTPEVIVAAIVFLLALSTFVFNIVSGRQAPKTNFVPSLSVSPVAADSSTWYCTLPPSGLLKGDSVDVYLINGSKYRQSVTVESYRSGASPSTVSLNLSSASSQSVTEKLQPNRPTGVTAFFTGGADLVMARLSGSFGSTETFCHPSPGPNWIVQGFSTEGNSDGYLQVFNPFGSDAIVDVTFMTPSGPNAPGPLQAVVLAAHQSMSVKISDWFQGVSTIGATVSTRIGRVVTGGVEVRSDTHSTGTSFILASPETFSQTLYPLLTQTANQSAILHLINVTNSDSSVLVNVTDLSSSNRQSKRTVTSFKEQVPAYSTISVPLKAAPGVPVGSFFSLDVKSNSQIASSVELVGSTLGPLLGFSLVSGVGTFWPSWISVLTTPPFTSSYKQVAVNYQSKRKNSTALISKLFVNGANPLPTDTGIDSVAGVSLNTRSDSFSVLPTDNSTGFPDLFVAHSSSASVMALAYIQSDGSMVPIPSIALD